MPAEKTAADTAETDSQQVCRNLRWHQKEKEGNRRRITQRRRKKRHTAMLPILTNHEEA